MSQKMDNMNAPAFFNFFGSITVKNNVEVFMAIAGVFQDEVDMIKDAAGLQLYIVYNPLTVPTIEQMRRFGGNALGIEPSDGPLTIVNINLHWSDSHDTDRMRLFMRQLICRFKDSAKSRDMLHPYLFQNHAFEEQDVFAGYGEENRARLARIRENVDAEGVLSKPTVTPETVYLCKGYAWFRDMKEERLFPDALANTVIHEWLFDWYTVNHTVAIGRPGVWGIQFKKSAAAAHDKTNMDVRATVPRP